MASSTPSLEVVSTTCPLDCPDLCKLLVTREDDRVVQISGAKDDPWTDGHICGKVRNYAQHVYSSIRIETPLLRSGPKGSGKFHSISWEDAYIRIAERIRHDRELFGGESILPLCYGGSNGKLTQDAMDARFFYRLGASRLDRTVCAAPSTAAYSALYGKMVGVAIQDYADSKMIVIWGNNPHASGIHLVQHVQRAQRQGAKLVVIDPRKTPLAARADLHLPVHPGTDLVVALAMIRWLSQQGLADLEFLEQHTSGYETLLERAEPWTIERAASVAHVSADSLESLCRMYAETRPAVIRCGWGPERNRNGGSAIAAILAIPAVANKFEPSGGFTMTNSAAWSLDNGRVIQAVPPNVRRVNMNLVGDALLHEQDPPIRLLFVYNCNPLATLPEQNKVLRGLQRDDLFSVVFDQVMTDTAAYADIVLPATTFLEHVDLRNGYGNPRLGYVRPVIQPYGQAKCNHEVFAELLDRLDLTEPGDLVSEEQLGEALLGDAQFKRLKEHGELTTPTGPRPVQMRDVFPATASRKIELFPESLEQESRVGLYRYIEPPSTDLYPLTLISPSTSHTVNSSLGYLVRRQAVAVVNPSDAASRGILDEHTIRIFNDLGEVVITARVDDAIAPGVVCLAKGLWLHQAQNGRTSNALTPDTLTDIGSGACFNDARVEIASV